jgi:hypothetical protein
MILNFQVVIHKMLDHNSMNLDIENDIYNEQISVEKHILKNRKFTF